MTTASATVNVDDPAAERSRRSEWMITSPAVIVSITSAPSACLDSFRSLIASLTMLYAKRYNKTYRALGASASQVLFIDTGARAMPESATRFARRG